jgi:lactate 2-monooxygenase
MRNYPGSFWNNLISKRPLKAVRKFISIYSRPSLTWEDLPFLREQTKLPIVLKGILHPDDARMAVDHGINGIIVSNHGGRQVDGAISTIEALPDIVAAVNGNIPVLMDSGVRGGADMFKAIALGANAVCIGRPFVYGLALAGQQGVVEVISNFKADFELTMGLAGCRSVGEISNEMLVKS